jgi:UDP-N-acetylglucosamine transferase subunit ALG13
MIFVTIGQVFPFDRLVRLSDATALLFPEERFFAQIGDGAYEPTHMEFARWLSRSEFAAKVSAAKLIVAHAGMGSVITAMELGKPIMLLPRRWEWGEHNTDHQMATARWLSQRSGVYVCMGDQDFRPTLAAALAGRGAQSVMPRSAPEPLLREIRAFMMDPEGALSGH